ncbi:hypothetical protein PGT21_015871 [Puccinia graminis f. sp. tritici]|uniref:Uncharacterized protein n=1 Tax=Puccinia graminis f. sp. tritici TaxID=56615 RepID=A0A5B0NYL5_PUCGR|nr:hypothetical protein PGT21_015871 [Puccinia graminis f. sp. tritici]
MAAQVLGITALRSSSHQDSNGHLASHPSNRLALLLDSNSTDLDTAPLLLEDRSG